MKKFIIFASLALVFTFGVITSLSVFANNDEASLASSSKVGTNVQGDSLVLKGEIGTIIRDGDLVFERVSEDSFPKDDESIIKPFGSTEGFKVNFGGNTSIIKEFNLAGDHHYWKVWIRNTGNNGIKYSTSGPVNGSVYTIPAGQTWNVYSTNPWPTGTYYSNFTGGSGMYGEAACRTATTFAELDI